MDFNKNDIIIALSTEYDMLIHIQKLFKNINVEKEKIINEMYKEYPKIKDKKLFGNVIDDLFNITKQLSLLNIRYSPENYNIRLDDIASYLNKEFNYDDDVMKLIIARLIKPEYFKELEDKTNKDLIEKFRKKLLIIFDNTQNKEEQLIIIKNFAEDEKNIFITSNEIIEIINNFLSIQYKFLHNNKELFEDIFFKYVENLIKLNLDELSDLLLDLDKLNKLKIKIEELKKLTIKLDELEELKNKLDELNKLTIKFDKLSKKILSLEKNDDIINLDNLHELISNEKNPNKINEIYNILSKILIIRLGIKLDYYINDTDIKYMFKIIINKLY